MPRVFFLLALLLSGCAVSPAPHADMSPALLRNAWVSKKPVQHVKKKEVKKHTTTPIATPRMPACDLVGFHAGYGRIERVMGFAEG
jgi:PBP1b-binding outer membrane lipoprotein LpoB